MINENKKVGFSITEFTLRDLDKFIKIHMEHLFSNSEFSKIYLRERFNYLLHFDSSITVCARNVYGEMMGFVYGGPEGYKKKMNQYAMKRISIRLLTKPKFLFGPEFIYKYKSIVYKLALFIFPQRKNVLKTEKDHSNSHSFILPEPILRLTGIAVQDEYGQLGIGKELLRAFEEEALSKNYASIIVETPVTNYRAIKFYEKYNWLKFSNRNTNLNKACFYRIIKNSEDR